MLRDRASVDFNPLTELPGLRRVERELTARLTQGKPFALINVDINSLRPFRNVYGATRSDDAIRLLARILGNAVKLLGNDDDIVGHVGEDDFYIISAPLTAHALCQKFISQFHGEIKNLYVQEDAVRGYLECEYPLGYIGRHPIMTLSVGVTTSANRVAANPLIMRRTASEVREYARTWLGSPVFFDQRGDDLTLEDSLGLSGRRSDIPVSSRNLARGQLDKVDFAHFVTSQLRVPVTIVQSTVDYLIQTEQLNLTVAQAHHLDVLKRHVRYLSDDISQLTTLYKVYRPDPQTQLETVDLTRVLAQIAELVEDAAGEKNVHVTMLGTENIGRVMVDEQKLCQALLYTLYSIVEYARPNAIIEIDVGESQSRVTLDVAVDDLNVARQEMARVFRTYHHPRTTTGTTCRSLGLGFHIAKQLVKSIGGTMTVRHRDRVRIGLGLPKSWQSVEEKPRLIQRELTAAQTTAEMEMDRLERLFAGGEDAPEETCRILATVGSSIERMALEASRAICLADEFSGLLAREKERSLALDAGFFTFLEALADLLEHRDSFFAGHSKRVALEAFSIGRQLRLPPDELKMLYYAALLHDVGMVAVPERIVSKTAELSSDELLIIQQHPITGARSIGVLEALGTVVQGILHHHERYDGSGYPLGLRGEGIPTTARILSVADVYDAMISSRPHRPPISTETAMETIAGCERTRFDPKVVAAFLKLHSYEGTSVSGTSVTDPGLPLHYEVEDRSVTT